MARIYTSAQIVLVWLVDAITKMTATLSGLKEIAGDTGNFRDQGIVPWFSKGA